MTKLRIYIDEVGGAEKRSETDASKRYLSLTGVIFRIDYIRHVLAHDLESLRLRHLHHHPDDPATLHRNKFEGMTGHYRKLRFGDAKERFYTDVTSFLRDHDYAVITSGLDKFKHFQRYSNWNEDPYHICLFNLLERYFLYLQNRRSEGDVFIEGRNKSQNDRLRNAYSDFYQNGTKGGAFQITASDIQKRFTSRKLAVREKVHNIAGLQVADLVALTMHNHCVQKYGEHQPTNSLDARFLPFLLDDKVLRNPNDGRIEGYGIIWRPK